LGVAIQSWRFDAGSATAPQWGSLLYIRSTPTRSAGQRGVIRKAVHMFLLPWEKWLPAWLMGPLLFIGSTAALLLDRSIHWWEYILLPGAAMLGAYQTWVWFKERRNILCEDSSPIDSGNNENSK
jgi:hypothetical protein